MTKNMEKYLDFLACNEDAKKEVEDYEKRLQEQWNQYNIDFASKHGMTLTQEDFNPSEEALDDDMLEGVAGGTRFSREDPSPETNKFNKPYFN